MCNGSSSGSKGIAQKVSSASNVIQKVSSKVIQKCFKRDLKRVLQSDSKVSSKVTQKCLKSDLKSELKSDLKVTSEGSRNRAL